MSGRVWQVVAYGRLKTKENLRLSKSGRVRLQEVVAYETLQL